MGPRRAITFPMFDDGIFTHEGEAWKHSREVIRPQFFHKEYEDLAIFKPPMNNFIGSLGNSKGVIDLQPLFFRLTLDVTTKYLFGESVESLKSPESAGENTFTGAFNLAQSYIIKRYRLLYFYWLIGGRKFHQACEDVHRFADQIIERNFSENQKKGGTDETQYFLQAVAKQTSNRATLRGQIINILVAGRDTTACLLSWTLQVFICIPNLNEKLTNIFQAFYLLEIH